MRSRPWVPQGTRPCRPRAASALAITPITTTNSTVRSPLSTGARNVIEYSDPSGEYAELRKWMKQRRLL